MFTLQRPKAAVIEQQIAAASRLPSFSPQILSLAGCLDPASRIPFGFTHDFRRSKRGNGNAAFSAAKLAFKRWTMFDIGWVRVANSLAPITVGQIVAVEVHALGLWSLNLSRITNTIDSATRFGFIYATTAAHVEQGQESFLLEFDPAGGDVYYDLEAISRPRNVLARAAFPITRAFQHRFARDSHERMYNEARS